MTKDKGRDCMSTKDEVLKYLQNHQQYVSGEELSEQLLVSRTAIWKNINTLRSSGYEIESVTNRGYRLVFSPNTISPEIILSGLKTKAMGKNVFCFDSIDSTNAQAKRQALAGASNGSLFIAEQQTGGKGRLGRVWASPSGTGLWFSVLLRPDSLPVQVTNITLLAGLAVCLSIRKLTKAPAMIKWPNDIVIGGKKVCGILTEMAAEIDRIEYVVVGIGINVNTENFPEELSVKATSLRVECGKPVARVELLQEILSEFERILSDYTDRPEAIFAEYKTLCVSLNRTVGFVRNKEPLTATAVDISPAGELVVRCGNGSLISINSGEVTVQGIYGQT
ncbi:biotin--[acetyl-CoA-carboxylase] ligase [Caproiciproducens faecalis]|uniref:Bifunctional ligase/repressor BirA n=1 Tax=Caproiciproducens faecalis TaxID=2820301 RepID=A0ABS7DQ29_9FIRM|nr:biotin--[acetyl-CoA-carboxylase] ligase [Caproiciproducens faecalis]MBW7573416.1 biotin--[acetyl-CoA-carboxylase] ligase [Caproiciproducens faecalis]